MKSEILQQQTKKPLARLKKLIPTNLLASILTIAHTNELITAEQHRTKLTLLKITRLQSSKDRERHKTGLLSYL